MKPHTTAHTIQAWALVIIGGYVMHRTAPHLFTLAAFWAACIAVAQLAARYRRWYFDSAAEARKIINAEREKWNAQCDKLNVRPEHWQQAIDGEPRARRYLKSGQWPN